MFSSYSFFAGYQEASFFSRNAGQKTGLFIWKKMNYSLNPNLEKYQSQKNPKKYPKIKINFSINYFNFLFSFDFSVFSYFYHQLSSLIFRNFI